MNVSLNDQAWDDLFGIWNHIANFSEHTADECIARIMARTDQLRHFPRSGKERPDIAPDARVLPIERWLIFYRIEGNDVQIARIVDAARDLRKVNSSHD